MILGFPPKPHTVAELLAIVNPTEAKQPEVIPAILYSTRAYVDNATTLLTFFDTNATLITRDNVNNGQLPAPQFFVIHRAFFDILRTPTSTLGAGGAAATGVAGAINDVELLTKVNNGGLFTLKISQKDYLRIPIRAMPAIGGATGLWQLNSSNVAASQPESIQQANNGIPGIGGFPVNGMVVIPPQTDFLGEVRWQAAVDLTANVDLCVSLYGALYRRVL